MTIILMGFKNVGKTTFGQQLADKLQWPFLDTDRLIEQRYSVQEGISRSTALIYKTHGEAYFRDIEFATISSIKIARPSIIATGGGAICHLPTVNALRSLGRIVYLKASQQVLTDRLLARKLPAFLEKSSDPKKAIVEMFQKRSPLYEACADYIVSVDGLSPQAIINQLCECKRDHGK